MLAFGMIGMPEVVLIGFIALLVYGKKLPEMARSLGKSVQEFKTGMQEKEQLSADPGLTAPSDSEQDSVKQLPKETDAPVTAKLES